MTFKDGLLAFFNAFDRHKGWPYVLGAASALWLVMFLSDLLLWLLGIAR